MSAALRLLRRIVSVPSAVGLDVDGSTPLKHCYPPRHLSMDAVVRAFIAYKFGDGRTLRDANTAPWRDSAAV